MGSGRKPIKLWGSDQMIRHQLQGPTKEFKKMLTISLISFISGLLICACADDADLRLLLYTEAFGIALLALGAYGLNVFGRKYGTKN